MSTEINITIGDQRLLQESKTRAAANQQSLDSRLEEQQLAEQLTEAVDEATPEDPRSDAFSLQLDRRPAAQRRKKEEEEYGLYHMSDTLPKALPFSGTSLPGGSWTYTNIVAGELISAQCVDDDGKPFTASYTVKVPTQLLTIDSHNSYFDRVERFQPTLNFKRPYVLAEFDQPETQFPNALPSVLKRWLLSINLVYTQIIYTCETYANRASSGSIYEVYTYSVRSDNPTPFPHTIVNSPMRILLNQTLTSSENAIFVTYVIKQRPHKVDKNTEGAFDFFGSAYTNRSNSLADSRSSSDDWVMFRPSLENLPVYAHYTRYDKNTRTTQTKVVQLQTQDLSNPNAFDPTTIAPYNNELRTVGPDDFLNFATRLALVNNMYADDPRKEIYSTTSSLDVALDQNYETFTYDKTKGYALFLSLHRSSQFEFYYVYRAEYPQGLNYSLAYAALRSAQDYFYNLEEPPVSFNSPIATTPARVVTYTLVDVPPFDPTKFRTGIAPFE